MGANTSAAQARKLLTAVIMHPARAARYISDDKPRIPETRLVSFTGLSAKRIHPELQTDFGDAGLEQTSRT